MSQITTNDFDVIKGYLDWKYLRLQRYLYKGLKCLKIINLFWCKYLLIKIKLLLLFLAYFNLAAVF